MKHGLMKKLAACITVLLALCIAASACADMLEDIRANGKIRVGVCAELVPFVLWKIDEDTKEQKLAGADVELAKAVAEAIGVDIEFFDQAFSGLLTSLAAGEMDILCSDISVRDERKEVVDFSEPYYYSRDILVTRSEDSEKFKSPADLAGKKIGLLAGTAEMLVRDRQFPDSTEVLLQSLPLMFMELVNGNVDGLLIPEMNYIQYYPLYVGKIARSGIEINNNRDPIAIAVRKGDNASLLEIINKVVADFLKDDKYIKILDKWTESVAA